MYNRSRMYGIVVSFALITPLLLINHFLFNNVMNILIPVIVILVTASSLRHVKSSHWYFRVSPIALIGIAIYLVLPSYTLSRAEQIIMESDSGITLIEQRNNTPMDGHGFAPFASKCFYTFGVTYSDGSEYELIFNPDLGEFFHKK